MAAHVLRKLGVSMGMVACMMEISHLHMVVRQVCVSVVRQVCVSIQCQVPVAVV